jgi:3-isopropylmalate/(R)-2-methylmalate dehydratase small subunit
MTRVAFIVGQAADLDWADIDNDQIAPPRLAPPRLITPRLITPNLAPHHLAPSDLAPPPITLSRLAPPHCIPPGVDDPPAEGAPADTLFHALRAADPAFPIAATGNPPFLLAGANFGCGGASDAAVCALLAGGIRCIIAPGFGPGFSRTAAHHGLLTITLPPAHLALLRADSRTGTEIDVDLEARRLRCGDLVYRFSIDRFSRHRLLLGEDELILTRQYELADAIDRFEGGDARRRPWATPT